jgi:hypothetical protein
MENEKVYVIFWEETLLNKWLANALRLKIKKEVFNNLGGIDINDYVLIDLHKNIDTSQIKDSVLWINEILKNSIFISLYVDSSIEQSKAIIESAKENLKWSDITIKYFTEFLNNSQNRSQSQ